MTTASTPAAVESFADWHDELAPGEGTGSYRSVLPATPPGPGQQYRFEVDLDRCSGCKACVSACHSLNGLDADESWRSVGLLVGSGHEVPGWTQHVTTACHHCVEPACLIGCPVEAYEKDPITGIVAHLDDQCIGCRYCMLTCPYEVPRFNDRLGVVRKCDMCSDRLADGEAPACVQGCPTEAISIGIVETASLAAEAVADPERRLVPTAPRSSLTTPTTVYLTARPVPADVVAADDHRLEPASNHPPLVAMLVLTQVSVGAVAIALLGARLGGWFGSPDAVGPGPAIAAWVTAVLAIAASIGHLGRPLLAWRAVLGVRHSWLSREIVAFGAYATLGALAVGAATGILPPGWEQGLGVATVVAGAAGIWCSAVLYAATGRAAWRLDRTLGRFALTSAVGGAALVAAVSCLVGAVDVGAVETESVRRICALIIISGTAAGVIGAAGFVLRHRGDDDALGRSARLLWGSLRSGAARCAMVAGLAAIAAAFLALGDWSPGWAAIWALATLWLVLCAAWAERRLFFVAVAPDRMPGGFH
jgi:formate dehydrogenase iron-sulfur subunit